MYDETKERKSGTRVILLVILCIAFLIAILWKQGLIHWEQSPEEQNEQIATVEKESTITPNSGFMVSESDWETLQNEVKQLRKEVEQLKAAKPKTTSTPKQTTTQNATQYPSVAAVKDFLYANFMTEQEIYDYLDSFYTQAEADDKFALKSNSYTKAEINAIQTENDKRFALHMSVAFDENGVPVKFVDKINLSAGDFTGDSITCAFIGSNVQLIQGGAFVGCHNLTDVYVDKKQSAITIQEGALPSGATVHYVDGFNYGELIIAAVKYLNTIKANAADVYTKTETDNIITSVVPVEFTVTLMSNEWTLDGKQYIDLPSGIVIGENTRIIDVECLNENDLSNAWGGESISIYIDTEANTNEKIYALAVADDDSVPNINVNIKIILSEVNVIESVPQ